MKRTLLFSALMAAIYGGSAPAQTTPAPGSVITAPGSQTTPGSQTAPGQPSSSFLTFTNPAGGSFSIDQLDSQLRNLQATVEQALPMLTAFNNQFGGSTGSQSIGSVLSRVFNRDGDASQSQGTSGNTATNWLSALGGLITGNTNASSGGLNQTTLAQLSTLQKQLQPVAQTLQSLNLGTAAGQSPAGTISSRTPASTNRFTGSTNLNNGPLAPTGR
jgi:hypothetical protein